MRTRRSRDPAEQPETFGPSPETFAFIVLSGLPLAMTITPWLRGNQPTRDLLISAGIVLFVSYAVLALRLTLSVEGIRYRSPFSRAPVVKWSSIVRVRVRAELLGGRTYPAYFMEIHASDRQGPVILNLRMFSRKALARLGTLLSERASSARLDEATTHLGKGRVPSVLFKDRHNGAV